MFSEKPAEGLVVVTIVASLNIRNPATPYSCGRSRRYTANSEEANGAIENPLVLR